MELILPDLGLFLWTTVLFLAVFFILRAFAWKPIMNALHEREDSITKSLAQAEEARNEMAKLTADNEALLKEARAERDKILREANEMKDRIVADAKKAAADAEGKEREKTKQLIESENRAALTEIRETAASIAIEVAEKILRKEFENKNQQEDFAKTLIKELNQN